MPERFSKPISKNIQAFSKKKNTDDTEGRIKGKLIEIHNLNMNKICVKLYQNQKIYLIHLEWMPILLNALTTRVCILGS